MVGPRRRRRRIARRRIGPLAAVLAIVVLVAFVVLSVRAATPSAQGRRQAERTYLALAYPLVEQSNAAGGTVSELRLTPAQLGPVTLRTDLGGLVTVTRDTSRSIDALDVPPTMRKGGEDLVRAMAGRAAAAADIRAGFETAVGSTTPTASVAALVRAGNEMTAADRQYAAFRASIPASAGGRRAVPASKWIADPSYWGPAPIASLVTALGPALTPARNLLLELVSLRPTPIATQPQIVIPTTTALNVSLVVNNLGNVPERGVPVVASLSGPGQQSRSHRQSVDLGPGQVRSVALGSFEVTPGTGYTLASSVGPVPGETTTQDNQLTMGVQIAS